MVHIICIISLPILILSTVFLFRKIWTAKSKFRSIMLNVSLFLYTCLFLFTCTETLFYYCYIQPDGFRLTLCSSRWFSRYWKPINSYGYRDIDHDNLQEKKILFVVGDSFVAGHGIKNCKDRFSNILAEKLGKNWEVINIAKIGWDMNDEYRAIVSYPCKPDAIILSHFINDMEGTAERAGMRRPSLTSPPPNIVKPFVERSYFLNILYWIMFTIRYSAELEKVYYEYLCAIYSNTEIWTMHEQELLKVAKFADDKNIELVVIVFPHICDIEKTKIFTLKVVNFLRYHKIEVIDFADQLVGRNPKKLIVNWADTHPNEKLNKEIGELLFNYIK